MRFAVSLTKTGKRGDEPLLTLASYRMDARYDGITFGQNAIVSGGLRKFVGDKLKSLGASERLPVHSLKICSRTTATGSS